MAESEFERIIASLGIDFSILDELQTVTVAGVEQDAEFSKALELVVADEWNERTVMDFLISMNAVCGRYEISELEAYSILATELQKRAAESG
jgi:hypothetical protein